MKEALEFHLEGLRLEHLDIPQSHTHSQYLEIAATT